MRCINLRRHWYQQEIEYTKMVNHTELKQPDLTYAFKNSTSLDPTDKSRIIWSIDPELLWSTIIVTSDSNMKTLDVE